MNNDPFSMMEPPVDPEDAAEELPTPEPKKEEPKPVIRESPAPTPAAPIARNSRVEITTESLDDFLAEVSRLSLILENTHQALKGIEKSTAVVQKLQSIADMDLKAFKNRFEDMVNNLDLNQHVKEAIQGALIPLTKEYHDSSVQLKNLIFELEGRILPEKKTNSGFKSFVVVIVLVLALGAGGFVWFQMQKSGGGEAQSSVSFGIINFVLKFEFL